MSTPLAWKIVTTANCSYSMPFETGPIAIWNDTVGSPITATVEGVGSVVPLDSECWLEVEYLADSSSRATLVNDGTADMLATAAAQSTSSATWPGVSSTKIATTWDASTAVAVTMSGGNLVATNTGTTATNQGVRVATAEGRTSGKFYFESTLTTLSGAGGSGVGIGVAITTATYATLGNNAAGGAMLFPASAGAGNIWSNGSNTSITLGGRSTGQVIGIAVDFDNRKIWWRVAPSGLWNASATADPAANIGGVNVPAGTMVPFQTFGNVSGTAGNVMTINFGATAFTGWAPVGFSPWGAPFSLSTTFTPAQAGWIYARIKCARPSSTFYIDPVVTLA